MVSSQRRRSRRVLRGRVDERACCLILYRLEVGMDEFRSRNGSGTHTYRMSNGREEWLGGFMVSPGKYSGDELRTFLLIFVPGEST